MIVVAAFLVVFLWWRFSASVLVVFCVLVEANKRNIMSVSQECCSKSVMPECHPESVLHSIILRVSYKSFIPRVSHKNLTLLYKIVIPSVCLSGASHTRVSPQDCSHKSVTPKLLYQRRTPSMSQECHSNGSNSRKSVLPKVTKTVQPESNPNDDVFQHSVFAASADEIKQKLLGIPYICLYIYL